MNAKSITTLIKNTSVITIAGLTILSGTPALVQAAPMSLPTSATISSARPLTERQLLQREYVHEQKWLAGQQRAIDMENTLGGKTQTWIDALKAKGKDTATLDQAMTVFNAQMVSAQSIHNTAATILSTHAGFGVNGFVTNFVLARVTVRDARQALENARRIRLQARNDLVRAIAQWRHANNEPTGSPVEAAQPNAADSVDQ